MDLASLTLAKLDLDELREEFMSARPFPHVMIEPFLSPEDAERIASAYPSFEDAEKIGHQFSAVNELRKIQVTDSAQFPEPIAELNTLLASDEFLKVIEHITGIDRLLADPSLAGGGMHMTGSRGRLDVHVDFNYLESDDVYRRLNLLLYLNPVWEREWGGAVELWDEKVKTKHHAFAPKLNRCVIFETSERSYHGVEEVVCPEGQTRNSFAVYYYTKEPPAGYDGVNHSTIFRARPDEHLKRYVLMPAERVKQKARETQNLARRATKKIKKLIK